MCPKGGTVRKYFLILAILVLTVFCIAPVAGLSVSSNPTPSQTVNESVKTSFLLTIRDLPSQAAIITIDTDLEKDMNNPIFFIKDQNLRVNDKHLEYKITDRNTPIIIQISGIVPKISQTTQWGGLTLTTYQHQPGYAYYRVAALDKNGEVLPQSSATQTFEVESIELQVFKEKLKKVNDETMKNYHDDLFNKGLVNEANRMVDLTLIRQQNETTQLLYLVVPIVIISLGLGFFLGYRHGKKKGGGLDGI
jgi:hypothetical protein